MSDNDLTQGVLALRRTVNHIKSRRARAGERGRLEHGLRCVPACLRWRLQFYLERAPVAAALDIHRLQGGAGAALSGCGCAEVGPRCHVNV